MALVWLLFASFALVLDAVVLYQAVRGSWRRVPFVLVVCGIQILAGASNAATSRFVGAHTPSYYQIYWVGDILAHAAVLSLVVSLIRKALQGKDTQENATKLLVIGILLFTLFSVYSFRDPLLNRWMTPITRNLSFLEEVLNLILWSVLIQRRASDYLLLMVSAGIGVQVTGEVIGHTLRLYTHSVSTVWVPNLLVFVAEVVCLCIWIWAFRSARLGQSSAGPLAALRRTPQIS